MCAGRLILLRVLALLASDQITIRASKIALVEDFGGEQFQWSTVDTGFGRQKAFHRVVSFP